MSRTRASGLIDTPGTQDSPDTATQDFVQESRQLANLKRMSNVLSSTQHEEHSDDDTITFNILSKTPNKKHPSRSPDTATTFNENYVTMEDPPLASFNDKNDTLPGQNAESLIKVKDKKQLPNVYSKLWKEFIDFIEDLCNDDNLRIESSKRELVQKIFAISSNREMLHFLNKGYPQRNKNEYDLPEQDYTIMLDVACDTFIERLIQKDYDFNIRDREFIHLYIRFFGCRPLRRQFQSIIDTHADERLNYIERMNKLYKQLKKSDNDNSKSDYELFYIYLCLRPRKYIQRYMDQTIAYWQKDYIEEHFTNEIEEFDRITGT